MGCAASAAKQPEQAGEGQRHEFCWQEPLVQFGFKIPKRIILGKPTWKLVKTHDAIFSSNSGSHHVNASYMVQTFWKLVSWGPSRSVPVQNLRKVSCIHTILKKKQTSEMLLTWHGVLCKFFFPWSYYSARPLLSYSKKTPMKGSLFPATCQAMEPLDLTGRIRCRVEGMGPSYVGPGWEHHMWMFCFSQPKPDTDTLQI